MARDLTAAQFCMALGRHGFESTGFMGYVRLAPPFAHVSVCSFNAGTNRRARLAYLIERQAEHEREAQQKAVA